MRLVTKVIFSVLGIGLLAAGATYFFHIENKVVVENPPQQVQPTEAEIRKRIGSQKDLPPIDWNKKP